MTFASSLTPETMDHIQDPEYLRIIGASLKLIEWGEKECI